jgi:flagellar protein FliS
VSPYESAGNVYQTQAIGTAGPAQLVIMLYDGAIAAIARAEHAMADDSRDRYEIVNRELTKAQDIVMELFLSLDRDLGGTIASNLAAIYEYCLATLTKANLEKTAGNLPDVKSNLVGLRDAFAEASAQLAAGAA